MIREGRAGRGGGVLLFGGMRVLFLLLLVLFSLVLDRGLYFSGLTVSSLYFGLRGYERAGGISKRSIGLTMTVSRP